MNRTSLTAEERALADKLARIAPRAEPSAALDARILAMAAEAHAQATTPPAKPRRWLPSLALAASLALVAGVIWRVHPVLNPQDTPPATAISEADAAAGLPPMPVTATMTDAPVELADVAAMPETNAASAAIEMAPPAASKAAPVAMSAAVAEEPLQLPPMALPAPAPPLGQAQQAQAAEAQRARQKVQESHSAKSTATMPSHAAARNAELAAPPPPAPPAPAAAVMMERAAPVAADTSESLDSIALTGTRILPGEPEIARIRGLIEQGHTRKARRELKKLMRRHPDIEVPDDLKELLD